MSFLNKHAHHRDQLSDSEGKGLNYASTRAKATFKNQKYSYNKFYKKLQNSDYYCIKIFQKVSDCASTHLMMQHWSLLLRCMLK